RTLGRSRRRSPLRSQTRRPQPRRTSTRQIPRPRSHPRKRPPPHLGKAHRASRHRNAPRLLEAQEGLAPRAQPAEFPRRLEAARPDTRRAKHHERSEWIAALARSEKRWTLQISAAPSAPLREKLVPTHCTTRSP